MTKSPAVVVTGPVAKCGAVHKAVVKVAKVAHAHKKPVVGWDTPYWTVTATTNGLVAGWFDPKGAVA